jgi:hypothetical protein
MPEEPSSLTIRGFEGRIMLKSGIHFFAAGAFLDELGIVSLSDPLLNRPLRVND